MAHVAFSRQALPDILLFELKVPASWLRNGRPHSPIWPNTSLIPSKRKRSGQYALMVQSTYKPLFSSRATVTPEGSL